MAQRNYECMFVLNSGKYASDPAGAENVLMEMFARLEAEVVAKSPWQDGRLAYPIDGHRKGLHFLAYFRMDGSQVQEMSRLCKLNDLVLRNMVIEHSETLFDAMSQALIQHGKGEAPPETAKDEAAKDEAAKDGDAKDGAAKDGATGDGAAKETEAETESGKKETAGTDS